MGFVRDETEGSIRARIEGPLSIYEVVGLREQLLSCLESCSTLEIDLSGVTDCDTAGLQLLFAARKTANQRNRMLSVNPLSQSVTDVLKGVGTEPTELMGHTVE